MAAATPADASTDEFLNKFSRQNAAFGAEVTMKMTKMKALVVGCSGVGVEVVKNLVLQGVGGVTLCDEKPVAIADLGLNFFLAEGDVGNPTAPLLVPRFQELNPFCNIKAIGALTPEVVAEHSVMIVTERMGLADLLKWDEICRSATPLPIGFMFVHTGGAFGSVFVDLGPAHCVHDSNGEAPMVRLVESIECGPDALVRLLVPDGQAPGSLAEGSFVEFSDVIGCDGLMTHEEPSPAGPVVTAWKIQSKPNDPVNTVRIGDTSGLPPYISGGMLTEKKVPTPFPFEPLSAALKNPGMPFCDMIGTDMVNFGSELQTHLAMHAILALEDERGSLLVPGDSEVAAVVAKAKELLASGGSAVETEVDEALFAKLVRHFHCTLQPFCAFLGGIVAQEVVKMAGKYTPIKGFLHLNVLEALPDEVATDCEPRGTRYDELASVYGHAFVEKLNNLKYFMVGCGALGCEFMKNFALNGVCCGETGCLTVTDADRIELSNLTRQFLFREHNVRQPKSVAASEMAKVMNPNMKVRALEMFVGTKSEDFFNDDFWAGQDGVCNALDNMEARFYVDEQVVKYEKPLLESGTMGPAGNVDPIVPHKTQTYKDGGQADEGGGIPMCTLRNFPHLPDHCIEWSRDQFELLFVKSGKQVKKFYEDPDAFMEDKATSTDSAQTIFELRGLLSVLNGLASPSMKAAGQISMDFFHLLFRDKIMDLTNALPADARIIDKETKLDKGPFWSGHKKFPTASTFDVNNETHWRFFLDTTALFAAMIGAVPPKQDGIDDYLNEIRTQAWVAEQVKDLVIIDYEAGAVNTEGDDAADLGADKPDAKAIVAGLIEKLVPFKSAPAPKVEEADFEKDDDFNFHIDFITRCANLRADNYHIPNSDFQKVKLIAGRIVPAIATTTAAVCGLVMFELFKVVMDKPVEAFMTRQLGLAVNTYTSFQTNPPPASCSGVQKTTPKAEELPANAFDDAGNIKSEYIMLEPYAAYPEKHTCWDKLKVPSSTMTLAEFRDWLQKEHKLKLKNWDFVLGWARREDDDGKEMKVPFSSQIYPPPISIDATLFPPLEDGQGDAMKKIQGNAAVPMAQKMRYLSEWQKAKKTGKLPEAETEVVTLEMPLRDVLKLMEKKANKGVADGVLCAKWGTAIHDLDGRKIWVIPADQTPSCSTIPDDEAAEPVDVRYLARIEIPLRE